MLTSASRATCSRLAAFPFSAKTRLAASIKRSRLRSPSERGRRVDLEGGTNRTSAIFLVKRRDTTYNKRSVPPNNTGERDLKHRKRETDGSAVIVGASLSGLMSALSPSRIGMKVTMLERSDRKARAGAALPVSEGLLGRLTGRNLEGDVLPSGPQAWADVHLRLRTVVNSDPNIRIRMPARVRIVDQDERSAWAATDNGEIVRGDIVVGADGHASVARRHVAPQQPDAVFAGYLIWLGIVDESSVKAAPWPA